MPRLSTRRSTFNILPLVVFILLILIVIWGGVRGFYTFRKSLDRHKPAQALSDLWNEKNYSELIYQSELRLEKNPFDGEALFFGGASSFYMALSMVSLEDKLNYLQESLRLLRLNMTGKDILYKKETYYLLGKCYVQLGPYYSDLALDYLIKARDEGYDNSDLDEYLAIAYSRMGNFEKSLSYLRAIAEKTPTASLYLRMGEDAFDMGQYEISRDYLAEAVEISRNEPVRLEALLKLGQLYFDIKNWTESQKVLSQYLDIDYNNADVHFMLGEVYYNLGDNASARLEWHRTERIDPDYREALLRLYN
ncbi:MAG: tetratricopeptide repeat protein [Spirochaetales bacterium]|nr:tetratricopeptide repeat protein [Spirochaetales bacterium]